MKTIFSLIAGLWLIIAVLSCGEELSEIAPVSPPGVILGQYNEATKSVGGRITAEGDGIVEFGHIWLTSPNRPTSLSQGDTARASALIGVDSFYTIIDLVDTTAQHYVWAYVKDVHDQPRFSDNHIVINPDNSNNPVAGFDVPPGPFKAPATLTFTSTSLRADELEWYVDDELIATNNPEFTYVFEKPGNYAVKLVAIGDGGVDDAITKTVAIEWNTYSKTETNYGEAIKILPLQNGDYLILAKKTTGSNTDIVLIKMGIFGNIKDTQTYDYSNSDTPSDMALLSDGALAIVGTTFNTTANNEDVLYIRVNINDLEVLNKRLLSANNNAGNDNGNCVMEFEGKVFIAGSTKLTGDDYDIFIALGPFGMKDGSPVSFEIAPVAIDLPNNEIAHSTILSNDGHMLIAGQSRTTGNTTWDAMLLKLSPSAGAAVPASGYPKTWGSTIDNDYAYGISQLSDNSFLMVGTTSYNGGTTNDINLMKLSASGPPLWSNLGMINDSDFDYGYGILPLNDGAFLVLGSSNDNALMMKRNNNNNLIWKEYYGSSGIDHFNSATVTPDGGFLAVGKQGGALLITKTDDSGKQ